MIDTDLSNCRVGCAVGCAHHFQMFETIRAFTMVMVGRAHPTSCAYHLRALKVSNEQ